MKNLNLVVTFKLANDCELHVKGAASIKVDGKGGLLLYDPQGASPERIDLCRLQSFSIRPLTGASLAMAALV